MRCTYDGNLSQGHAANSSRKSTRGWVALDKHDYVVGLPENFPVPEVPNTLFVDAWDERVRNILTHLILATCSTEAEILRDFIIPYMDNQILNKWTSPYKEQTIERVLQRFHMLGETCQKKVKSLPMVPVANISHKSLPTFEVASRLVDPSAQSLTDLFFDDERCCPDKWVTDRYRGVVFDCGLKVSLDNELLKDRVCTFASGPYSPDDVMLRAYKLLKTSLSATDNSHENINAIVREYQWLPAHSRNGNLSLMQSNKCRDIGDQDLVGYVQPIVELKVSRDWRSRLGWDMPISKVLLLQQLDQGIIHNDITVVNAVLIYIVKEEMVELTYSKLVDRRLILTQDGHLELPQKVFQAGCDGLAPFLYNVDPVFWHTHQKLIVRLSVKDRPTFEDLLNVQKTLQSPLSESEVSVSINILKLVTTFPKDCWPSFKVPSKDAELFNIDEVVFNDIGPQTFTKGYSSTHPDIPLDLVFKLGIEPLSERVSKGKLGIADEDEDDEFDQREEVTTGIADTLGRYPIDTTFKEYLANADDAHAESLNWLLDGRTFSIKSLLTPEMANLQGPSLLVHNDGGRWILQLYKETTNRNTSI